MYVCVDVYVLLLVWVIYYSICNTMFFSWGKKDRITFSPFASKKGQMCDTGEGFCPRCFALTTAPDCSQWGLFVHTLTLQIPASITYSPIKACLRVLSPALGVTSISYVLDIRFSYFHTYSYFSHFNCPHEHNINLFSSQKCTPPPPTHPCPAFE